MSRRLAFLVPVFAAVLAGGSFLAGRAVSEEPPAGSPSKEEMMAEWAKMMTPGPQHELLKTFEGAWVGNGTWTEGGNTSTFTEEATSKLAFGGRFLETDTKMTAEMEPGKPMTMSSRGYMGFDNAKQKYVFAMVGEWSTAIGTAEGAYDAATKTLTMTGVEVLGPGKERKYRMVQKLVSADQWTFEIYFTGADGKETKAAEAVYKRK
jgi:hypothetical protein